MGNDNCGCLVGWPKAKKSKTDQVVSSGNWAQLPSVILYDVFSFLSQKDRINASSVCRNWRHVIFHPNFWNEFTFTIQAGQHEKTKYLSRTLSSLVKNAVIKFDSLTPVCMTEFTALLQNLSTNTKLKSLMLEPSHCRLVEPVEYCFDTLNYFSNLSEIIKIFCNFPLEKFSIGGCEELCQFVPQYLERLSNTRPEQVSILGLASVKDDPSNYLICEVDAVLFSAFRNLKILSIDYDALCDDVLDTLNGAENLKRLIVHVHGVWFGHPGTSNEAWAKFKQVHPTCEFRLTLIHAYEEVFHMENGILQIQMPLTHLKVFFCEHINVDVLNLLSSWYPQTLRSIMWVDSRSPDLEGTWDLVNRFRDAEINEPDPLVMAAWLCTKLEEVVLLGYKYYEEDLVAIARLRGNTLKNLEVASEDIISNEGCKIPTNLIEEMSKIFDRPWAPLKSSELHPVICNPTDGDSDEYLQPKVLADLHL
ncbi:F-box only protein 33 isoform X2 [Agrilus planipennis]|nr:F-box only protein 33 isoform X2 [Agrilus planipennis]